MLFGNERRKREIIFYFSFATFKTFPWNILATENKHYSFLKPFFNIFKLWTSEHCKCRLFNKNISYFIFVWISAWVKKNNRQTRWDKNNNNNNNNNNDNNNDNNNINNKGLQNTSGLFNNVCMWTDLIEEY